MKRNLVILAVLATLVSTAPAAADSAINLTLSSANPYLGTPITYQVSGEAEVHETYEVRIMYVGLSGANCGKARPTESSQVREVEVQGKAATLIPFNYSATLPIEDYSALGTYAVCANVRGESPAESLTSFTVSAEPAPVPPPTLVVAPTVTPAPAPVVTPSPAVAPATPVVKPVVKPVSKLAKALKLCKKLKKHGKRVACEKRAKRSHKK
jgi:hypothetical protein